MKENKVKIKVGIFSLSMLSMATLIISPVIGMIVSDFPEKGVNQVQMILSIAQLTGIIAAFIVGKLALSLPKKNIALSGVLGVFLFGMASYFFHNSLTLLIVFSGLIGVSVGFITNVIPGLIADNFKVEDRQEIMGKQVFFVSIGTMFMMFMSGFLGTSNWYNSYFTYLFALLVFITAYYCLPKSEVIKKTEKEKHSLKEVLNNQIIIIAFMGFCFLIVNNAYNNNISILISEEGFGNSSISGTMTMIAQLGGLLTGLLAGKISKLIKSNTIIFSFIIQGLSLIILAFANNIPVLILGSFLSGSAQALFFSQAPFLITISVHPILIPMGMAVLSTANSIGGFLSPTIINLLNSTVGSSTAQGAMTVGGILSFVMVIIMFFINVNQKKAVSVK